MNMASKDGKTEIRDQTGPIDECSRLSGRDIWEEWGLGFSGNTQPASRGQCYSTTPSCHHMGMWPWHCKLPDH